MPVSRRTKRRLIALGLVVVAMGVALAGLFVVRQTVRDRTLTRERELGMAAYEAERYDEALSHLARYHGARPEDVEAWIATADARRRVPNERRDHLAQALGLVRQAVARDPSNAEAVRLELELEIATGQRTEALATADRLLEIEPGDRDALTVRAIVHRALGNTEAAAEAVAELEAAYPDSFETRYFALESRLALGRDAASLAAELDEASRTGPHAEIATVLASIAHQRARDLEAARDTLARLDPAALADRPPLLDAALRLYDLLAMDDAARAASEAAVATGEPDAVVVVAERAWKNGDPPAAMATLETIQDDLTEADDRTLGLSAFLATAIREGEAASELVAALRSRETLVARSWAERLDALLAFNAGAFADARTRLRSLLERNRGDALVWFLLADAEYALGERRVAAEAYERAATLDPRWLTAHLRLTDTLIETGSPREARDAARDGLAAFPRETMLVDAWIRATTILAERGDLLADELSDAIEFVGRLSAAAPENGDLLATLAQLRFARGDVEAGRTIANALLAEGRPINAEPRRRLAAAMRDAGIEPPAALLESPEENDGASPLGRALAALRDGDEARGRAILTEAEDTDEKTAALSQAIFAARAGEADAAEQLARVAARYDTDARVQLSVLQENAIWSDPSLAAPAIGRLRELTGPTAINWRVFDSRRKLATDRSERTAADVATMLGPVLRRDERNVPALLLMADAMDVLGDDENALTYLGRAVAAAPMRVDLQPAYIRALRAAGRDEAAEEALNGFAAVRALTPAVQRERAQLLLSFGRSDAALADLRAVAAATEIESDRLRLAALLAERDPRDDEARELFEALLAQAEPSAEALRAAAEWRWRLDDGEAARTIAARLGADEGRELFLAELEARYGDARSAAERLRPLAINDADAARLLVSVLASAGEIAEAQSAADAAAQRFASDAHLSAAAGALRLASGSGAAAEVTAAIVSLPADDGVTRALEIAAAFGGDGDLESATTELETAAAVHPQSYAIPALHAALLRDAGRMNEAIALYRSAAARMPTDAAPVRALAGGLLATGRLEEAAVAAEAWRSRLVGDAFPADLFRARVESRLGRWSNVSEALEPYAARIREGDSAEALLLLAQARAAVGDAEGARTLLADKMAADPAWARAALGVARLIRGANAARSWIEAAAAEVDDSVETRAQIAAAWFELAQRSGARGDLETAAEVAAGAAPDGPAETLTIAAVAHEALGRTDEAERFYRLAVDAGSTDPIVLNNYAYLLLGSADTDPAEAVDLARRAVEGSDILPPAARASFLDTLGVGLLRAGDAEGAAAAFEEALDITPGVGRLTVGLAESLAQRGDADAAREMLLRMREDETITDRVRTRLEALRATLGDG